MHTWQTEPAADASHAATLDAHPDTLQIAGPDWGNVPSGVECCRSLGYVVVFGVTVTVSAGLLTVALCHLCLPLSWDRSLGLSLSRLWAYSMGKPYILGIPRFGKALYAKPREATG